ncbi:DUF2470 domain-containing protein [Suttonella sp. R2A3]|uniref:HugZ family pyridoxamine 5'-phosphate oxidase n=1 Tax=Suttonella sp. R2A3 TaxID=2908648 RepID=UPI001F1F7578|nr:DUF2470 domain-containing protein [Suttonella sp. R2A3]UJF25080.1 DUF2470 domain-containing protein [Suttonella sp. R2A3]
MDKILTNKEVQRATTYTTKQAMVDLRQHMLSSFAGSLATICRDDHPLTGYPVSSVVPFFLDKNFNPIIQIANVAEHTHNADANPKASIFLRERYDGGDVQKQWRICMVGDLQRVPAEDIEEIAEQYYAHYPHARTFKRMHDFFFFRLHIKKYRIIMGFGDIRWIAGDAPYHPCPFDAETKQRMITHMNEDHMDAMCRYLRDMNIAVNDDDEVTMCAIHQYGFVLRHGEALYFVPFAEQPKDATEVREALVAMAKA